MEIVKTGVVSTPPPLTELEKPVQKLSLWDKITPYIHYGVLTIWTVNLIIFGLSKALLHPDNFYLGLLGIPENVTQKEQRLQRVFENDMNESVLLQEKRAKIEHQIETSNFYENSEQIETIRSKQKQWNDSLAQGKLSIGFLDLLQKIPVYFNEGFFSHPVLFSQGNTVEIQQFSFSPDQANLTIYCSNFFGNVFLLSSEIIELFNGLPQFREGKILNFYRHEEKNKGDTMSFTLNLKLQLPEEKDPQDENQTSKNFMDWINQKN